jgi:hypothetical protein
MAARTPAAEFGVPEIGRALGGAASQRPGGVVDQSAGLLPGVPEVIFDGCGDAVGVTGGEQI